MCKKVETSNIAAAYFFLAIYLRQGGEKEGDEW